MTTSLWVCMWAISWSTGQSIRPFSLQFVSFFTVPLKALSLSQTEEKKLSCSWNVMVCPFVNLAVKLLLKKSRLSKWKQPPFYSDSYLRKMEAAGSFFFLFTLLQCDNGVGRTYNCIVLYRDFFFCVFLVYVHSVCIYISIHHLEYKEKDSENALWSSFSSPTTS